MSGPEQVRVAHTPGPWSVPHFVSDDCSCNCGYVLSEYQQGMGAIATVHFSTKEQDWRDGDHEPLEIAKVNARLIAAAPDLLAALIALAPSDFDEHPNDFMPEWHAARAAIAKATKDPSNG